MAQASLKLSVLLTGLLILEAQLWVAVPWVHDGKKKVRPLRALPGD